MAMTLQEVQEHLERARRALAEAERAIVEALQVAVDHPCEVLNDPKAIEAVRALYRVALEAGIPVPQGVQALVKKGRGKVLLG